MLNTSRPAPPQASDPTPISNKSVNVFPGWYIHQSLSDSTTPSRVVHCVRESSGSDRVSLLKKRGQGWKVIEVSGVTKIHRHSQTVHAIEASAKVLLGPGESVLYPHPAERSPTEEEAIDRLLDATGSNYWMLIPLDSVRAKDIGKDEDSLRIPSRSDGKKAEFALFCEKFEGEAYDESRFEDQALWKNCSVALENWNYLRKIPAAAMQSSISRLFGAHLWIKLSLILLLALLAPSLLKLVPATHQVEAGGRLVATHSQNLYAPSTATVMKVLVAHGQSVEAGEVLLELESSQILQLQRELIGQIQLNQEQLFALKSQQLSSLSGKGESFGSKGNNNRSSNATEMGTYSEVQQLEATIENLQKQLALVDSDLDKLKIRSPYRGRIATWDVRERLHQRPVRIGDWLLTVEPTDQVEWGIELELPPRTVGAILKSPSQGKESEVRFRLGSAPEKSYSAKLQRIGSVSQASENGTSVVYGTAAVGSDLDRQMLQSGTDVRALIDCGESNLWDVWTYDLKHWWNYRVAPYFERFLGRSKESN